MSDSSKFDSNNFAQDYCKGKKVKLIKAEFPIGWVEIFTNFIDAVHNYQIFIDKIDYEYEQMDIYLDLRNTTRAAKIIEEAQKCRIESRKVCASCGGAKNRSYGLNKMYCSNCLSDPSIEKKTGTWLDRY